MEEHLLSSLSMELFLPAEHIPDSLPPKLQLEAVRKAPRKDVAFQGEDFAVFLVVGIPEAQRYQGRALNHWRHFFSNLCITLQLAQPDHPAGAAEDAERDERERRPHARNVRNTRSMDDQSWERELAGRTAASSTPATSGAGSRGLLLPLQSSRNATAAPGVLPSASLLAAGTLETEVRVGTHGASAQEKGQVHGVGGSGIMIGTSHVLYRVSSRIAVDRALLPSSLMVRVLVSPSSFPLDEAKASFPPPAHRDADAHPATATATHPDGDASASANMHSSMDTRAHPAPVRPQADAAGATVGVGCGGWDGGQHLSRCLHALLYAPPAPRVCSGYLL
eukprot:Tamp_16281.p1 GENE.Tamp_16281~~Tamp_16281.p1  ORF type:complete len:336 (+),score=53.04 Tamp_16281:231-1238(+)